MNIVCNFKYSEGQEVYISKYSLLNLYNKEQNPTKKCNKAIEVLYERGTLFKNLPDILKVTINSTFFIVNEDGGIARQRLNPLYKCSLESIEGELLLFEDDLFDFDDKDNIAYTIAFSDEDTYLVTSSKVSETIRIVNKDKPTKWSRSVDYNIMLRLHSGTIPKNKFFNTSNLVYTNDYKPAVTIIKFSNKSVEYIATSLLIQVDSRKFLIDLDENMNLSCIGEPKMHNYQYYKPSFNIDTSL